MPKCHGYEMNTHELVPGNLLDTTKWDNLQVKEFTCNECDNTILCRYAYDLYNTDGDCLAMK